MRVLLVEDDLPLGEAVAAVLRQEGYAIDWMRDGASADAALAVEDFDVCVLDLTLPGKDGMDVLAAARQAGRTLPVLVLTARDRLEDRVEGLDAGADDYLTKPFDLEELLARLRSLLRRAGRRADSRIVHADIPFQNITGSIAERHADSLEPIPDQGVPREIAPLVHALNNLLARLESRMESARRFTADASHELRTPLAALKVQAQMALRAESDAARHHALDNVIAGVDRATHLLEQLLTLARVDPDTHVERATPVDLKAITEDVIADLDAMARRKRIEVALRADSARVPGRRGALTVLVRNLVDNAIRYSPDGASVDVSIDDRGDSVVLAVRDLGPGIPVEDRTRVFHRFYRRLGTDAGGTGLGLSIVARVAELHEAEIVLEDAEPDQPDHPGLQISVRLPKIAAQAPA